MMNPGLSFSSQISRNKSEFSASGSATKDDHVTKNQRLPDSLEPSGDQPMMSPGLSSSSQIPRHESEFSASGSATKVDHVTKNQRLPDSLKPSGENRMMSPGLSSSSQISRHESETEISTSGSATKARKRLNELRERKIENEEKENRARYFVIDTTVSTLDKSLRLSQRYTYFYDILIAKVSSKGKNKEKRGIYVTVFMFSHKHDI